jgi:hypothetical protein
MDVIQKAAIWEKVVSAIDTLVLIFLALGNGIPLTLISLGSYSAFIWVLFLWSFFAVWSDIVIIFNIHPRRQTPPAWAMSMYVRIPVTVIVFFFYFPGILLGNSRWLGYFR